MSEPRVAVVTGARKGIGREIALHYLETGGWIVVGASRGDGTIDAPCYEHVCVDVTDDDGVADMFTTVRRRFGRLDLLVNNAGVASMNSSLLTPASTVKRVTDTNLVGTFSCSREAAKIMRRRRWGRIVNFTSVAVPLELEGEAAYVASKAGVVGLSRVFARELARDGITVNVVGPGPVETDMIGNVPEEAMRRLLERLPLPRYTRPEDITNVIDFLVRAESDAVTGQVIHLGGA